MDTLKYEITDRGNSLEKYNFFLKNMEAEKTLEQLVMEILKKKERAKVFDLGCGDGGALKELKKKFGEKIITCGLDALEAEGLDEFVKGDARKEEFPKECDIVVSFRALHEIAHLQKIFEKLSSCLAEGAKAFLSIRCEQAIGDKITFHGNLQKKDINFLQKIGFEHKFRKMRVLVIEVKQLSPKGQEFIAGANVFLIKNQA